MDDCTSIHRSIPTLPIHNRVRAVFGAVCIVAIVACSGVAVKAAVMHLEGRGMHRVSHHQPDPRAARNDDYVQLLAGIDDRLAWPSGLEDMAQRFP
jgi:hypothetical protein